MGNILVKLEKHVLYPMGHYSNIFFGMVYDNHYEKMTIATKMCNQDYLVELVEDLLKRKIRLSLLQTQFRGVLCRINIYEVSEKKHMSYLKKLVADKYEIQKVEYLGVYFNVLNKRNF